MGRRLPVGTARLLGERVRRLLVETMKQLPVETARQPVVERVPALRSGDWLVEGNEEQLAVRKAVPRAESSPV